jgi:hypothetical protein
MDGLSQIGHDSAGELCGFWRAVGMTKPIPLHALNSIIGADIRPSEKRLTSSIDYLILYSTWASELMLLDPMDGRSKVIAKETGWINAFVPWGNKIFYGGDFVDGMKRHRNILLDPYNDTKQTIQYENGSTTAMVLIPELSFHPESLIVYNANRIVGNKKHVRIFNPDRMFIGFTEANGSVDDIAFDPCAAPARQHLLDGLYYSCQSDNGDYRIFRFQSDQALVSEECRISHVAAVNGVLYYSVVLADGLDKKVMVKSKDIKSNAMKEYRIFSHIGSIVPYEDTVLLASNNKSINWSLFMMDINGNGVEICQVPSWVVSAIPVKREVFGGLLL